jgi:hypothetical protein
MFQDGHRLARPEPSPDTASPTSARRFATARLRLGRVQSGTATQESHAIPYRLMVEL